MLNPQKTFLLMFSPKFIPLPVHVQLVVLTTDQPNNTVKFRTLLLNRCQKEFEKDDEVDDVVFERKQKELDSAAWGSLLKHLLVFVSTLFKRFVSLVPSDWVWSSSGRAAGGQGHCQAAFHRQHQVHRQTLQTQDVNGGRHAPLRGQAAPEPRPDVFRVSVQTAHHHRQGPWHWGGQGELVVVHLT